MRHETKIRLIMYCTTYLNITWFEVYKEEISNDQTNWNSHKEPTSAPKGVQETHKKPPLFAANCRVGDGHFRRRLAGQGFYFLFTLMEKFFWSLERKNEKNILSSFANPPKKTRFVVTFWRQEGLIREIQLKKCLHVASLNHNFRWEYF